jgi:alkylation response protein AidB-like acyl-CoA dehydrogenase
VTELDGQDAGFAELHGELRTVARDLLKAPAPNWSLLVRSGWTGLEVPEDLDGAGATFAETAVILGEMGRAATRSPYLGVTLGVAALLAAVPGARRDDLLRRTAAGREVPVAVLGGWPAPAAGPSRPGGLAGQTGHGSFGIEGRRIFGRAEFLPDAGEASRLLLLARMPGAHGWPVIVDVAAGAPGLTVELQPVADETRRLAAVTADGLEVPESSVWLLSGDDQQGAAGRLLNRAAVAIACDSLGLMQAMLDATVSYAKVRQQFGRPIGSFQAVQHACADMLVHVSVCRELVEAAVSAVVSGAGDAWVAASMAKSHVTAAAVDVVGKAMQLHGGIGYTWESGIHAYLKRATLNRALFGSPAQHRRRLATRYG